MAARLGSERGGVVRVVRLRLRGGFVGCACRPGRPEQPHPPLELVTLVFPSPAVPGRPVLSVTHGVARRVLASHSVAGTPGPRAVTARKTGAAVRANRVPAALRSRRRRPARSQPTTQPQSLLGGSCGGRLEVREPLQLTQRLRRPNPQRSLRRDPTRHKPGDCEQQRDARENPGAWIGKL